MSSMTADPISTATAPAIIISRTSSALDTPPHPTMGMEQASYSS